MLTEKQLKEIEERASKATPGPWTLDINYLVGFPPKTRPTGESIMLLEETCRAGSAEADDANMEFIAHAREDVPALLEEVKRLQEALVEERAWANEFEGQAKVNLMQLQGGFGSPTLVKQVEDTYSRPERKKYLNIERARAELQSEGRILK